MSTIETLVIAQPRGEPEFEHLSREQLEAELRLLRRRESLFGATETIANIGNFEWNFDEDRLESCSIVYAGLFDMSVEEALAAQSSTEKTLQMIHPDDHDAYLHAARTLQVNRSLKTDYRILLADGSLRYVREFSRMPTVTGDNVSTCFGLLQDVSEQVRYERDLESRDEVARQTEMITDIGHFIYDELKQQCDYLSDGYARIFGTGDKKQLCAVQNVEHEFSMIMPEDRERVRNEYEHYLETTEDCAVEYRIRREDGVARWIRELSTARQVEDGRVIQTLGVVQDITDRVNREQELMFKDSMALQAEALTDMGYFLFDEITDRHLYVSPGQARIVGLSVGEYQNRVVTNEDYYSLVYAEDRALVREAYEGVLKSHGGWSIEYRVQLPSGELRWVHEEGKAHRRKGDRVEQTLGVLRDITEQKQNEQELLYKDALANQAEAITEIGHFLYDEIKREYLFVSPGLARIFDVDANSSIEAFLARHNQLEYVHPEDRDYVRSVYDRFLINGGEWQVEFRLLRASGDIRWVREIGKAHLITRGIAEQTIGIIQDITVQKEAEQEIIRARDTLEQQVFARTHELASTIKQLQIEIEEREKVSAELEFLANHDALTGLPSLRLCKDRLDQSLAEARRNRQTSAVMFLDLDGFKAINDEHGHDLGDQVLKETAARIRHAIRETDTLARIGGDEFVIILSNLPQISIAERVAENVVREVSLPVKIGGSTMKLGASIGISLYPENGITAGELIRSADQAMYQVKRRGKNGFGFLDSFDR